MPLKPIKFNSRMNKKLKEFVKKKHYNGLRLFINQFKIRVPSIEPTILSSNSPEACYQYAAQNIDGPWPEAEPTILKDMYRAYCYSVFILNKRWPELEQKFKQKDYSEWKFLYQKYKKHFKIK